MTTPRRSEVGDREAQPASERRGPAWLEPAIARVDAQLTQTPPPLDAQLRRALQHLLSRHGAPRLLDLVLGAAATPFVPLLDALARDLGVGEHERCLVFIGEATLLSYLHVRLQDDVVDEPRDWGRESVFAIEVLSCASVAAFARGCGEAASDFLSFRAPVMNRFAASAAEELACRRTNRPLDAARIADKFLPLAPCLAAVAFAARRPTLAEPLVQLVLTLGDALQTANDLLNVAEDTGGARSTPVVDALEAQGELAQHAPARLALLSSAVLERHLAHAHAALAQAIALTHRFELPHLGRVVAARRHFLDSIPTRLLQLQLGGGIS